MIGFISRAFTVIAGLAVVASVAMAGVPDPTTSTTDGPIMLGNARGFGVVAGLPGVAATIPNGYEVIVRDNGSNLLPGVGVAMILAGVDPSFGPHSGQSGGAVANCAAGTISLVTDVNGRVIFFPATVGQNPSAVANVPIRANGIQLTTITLRSIDLVKTGGGGNSVVGVADLNEFRLRFLGQGGHTNQDPECDYATTNNPAPPGAQVGASDLNVFRTEFLCGAAGGAPVPCNKVECP